MPLSYQWKRNGVDISGATSASYTIPSIDLSDNGSTFRVNVTNSAGSVMSDAATLTVISPVISPPSITMQPLDQMVNEGEIAIFSVVATGTEPMTYQWQKNGTNIFSATGATYIIPSTALADDGTAFRVVVSNTAGSITSNNATLTVVLSPTAPAIITQPLRAYPKSQ